MNTAIEQNTLLWVKQELDETLRQARQMLEAHVEQPEDPSHLRFCAGYLHQVAGTLQMVEIYGASLLAEEMEQLVLDLLEGRVTQRDEACELLMQGIIQLPDYLDRLAAGHRDIPLVLLPLLNDLRAVRGEPLLSENALFTPDLDRRLPVSVRGLQEAEAPDPAVLARQLRHRYQLGLLGWFREREPQQALADIESVLERLRTACRTEEAQKLWWIAGGLARALRKGLLESSMASKLLLGQVDRMIKRLIDAGEDGLVHDLPEELLRNLLFYVGRAREGDDDVDLIRQTWNLDRLLPDTQEIEAARESLSGHNQSLIASVTAAVREDLAALCEQLDVRLRAESPDPEGLDRLREPLQRVADTLGMIGMGALRRRILEQADALDTALGGQDEGREAALQALAEALVMVDSALEGLQSGALDQAQLAPEEGDVSTLVPAAEFNQVRGTVTTEALAEIARAKEALTAYLEQPADRAPLEAVPEALARVRGSLLLLEEERAARLLERLTDAVRDSLGGAQEVPGDEVLEPLAEALSAIEYYIENLRAPKVYGAEILDVAEAALDRLGLSPALQAVAAPRAPEAVDTSAPEDDAGAAEAAAGAGEAESPADHAPAEAVSETHVPGGPEAGVEPVEDLGAVPAPEPPGDSLEMEVEEIDLGVPVAEVEEVLAEPAEAAAMPEGGSGPGVPAAAPPPFEAPWPVLEDEGVDEEILEIFLEEADEEIGNIRTLLPRWLESPEDAEALTEMRRSWHTLKGSGRLVGAQLIGEFAWAFENLLNRVIDGTVTRSAAMETLLEAGLQALPQLVAQLRGEGDPELDVVAMIEDAGVLARGEAIASRDYRRAPVSQPPAPPPTEAGDAGDAAEGVEVIALPEVEAAVEEPLLEGSSSAPAEADETAATPVASKAESAMDPELCAIFQREAEGHLAVLEDHVTRARAEGQGVDEALVRALHTLHGSACMAGVDAVARIAGALEQLVKSRTPAGSRLTDEALEVMEAAIRGVREVLERLAEPGAAQPDVASLVARIEALPVVSVAGEPVGGEDAAGEEEVVLEAVDDAPVAEEVVEVPDVTGEPAIGEDAAGEEEIVLEAMDDAPVAEEVVEVPGAAGEPAVGEDAAGEEEIVLEAVDDAPVAEEVVEATEVRVEDREAPGEGTPAQASESPDAPEGAAAGAREDASPADRPAQTGEAVAEEVDPELVEIFLEEGEEILARMEEVLGRWMAAPGDRALIHALQRELHTLKGGARMAGLTGIADLSHQLESFQIAVEEGRIPVTPPVFELMQLAHDRLVGMLEAAAAGRAPDAPADLLAHIEAVRKGEPAAAPAAPVPREETPASAGGTDEQAAVAAALAARADAAAQPVPSSEAPRQGTGAQPEKQEMVRVRADLLDDMVNYAGEISIYRARLEQQVGAYRFNLNELTQTVMRLREQLRQMEIETETQIVARYERETGDLAHEEFDPLEMDQYSTLQTLSRAMGESINDLISLHDQLDAITKEAETLLVQQARVNTELQEGLMRTRMVPFSGLAPRMRRIVRQACRDLGKRAELVLEGAEGEMDRTVIERIVAPLEHMLRNAVAHGIEPPAVRREKGKRETGTIRVSLHREGSEVVIRLSDDGAGMDVEAIRAKAVERGLIKPDARLGDREIIQFVLETGFSTAGEVNQVAGRGVGLDVVHNEVKQLGGTLSIDSTTGAGTTFTIRLPFTLAITQALLVRVGEELFAIPLTSIEGVVRMAQEELRGYYADPERRFEYAGYRYQVQHLGRLLGQESAPVFGKGTPRRLPVLLVRVGDQCMALQVDALLGSREAVVKSVGPQISTVRGVSGATILGDGRVVLILDMAGLLRSLEARSVQEEAFAVTAGVAEADATRVPLVMVVDDSITVRKVTRRLLERNGMQVVTAKDGVDAVAKLQDHVPDAMLLDIEMPRMDGFELATHIRNEPRLQHIPIVMITSRTGEKHRRRALEIGVDRYLGKPYQEAELLATLQELMEARAAHA